MPMIPVPILTEHQLGVLRQMTDGDAQRGDYPATVVAYLDRLWLVFVEPKSRTASLTMFGEVLLRALDDNAAEYAGVYPRLTVAETSRMRSMCAGWQFGDNCAARIMAVLERLCRMRLAERNEYGYQATAFGRAALAEHDRHGSE